MDKHIKWIAPRWYCICHAVVAQSTKQQIFYGDCTPDMDLAKGHGDILPFFKHISAPNFWFTGAMAGLLCKQNPHKRQG